MCHCRPTNGLRAAWWIAVWLCVVSNFSLAAVQPDFLIDSDPELALPDDLRNFNPAYKAVWLAALKRPETDMQRMAAETIARGHQYGFPGLEEAIPELERILSAETSHASARFAAARALIVLDSRKSAEKLFAAGRTHGAGLRQLVEPALAEWNYEPIKAVWIERLADPQAELRDRVLAMRGMAQTRDASALPTLMNIARDELVSADYRLEAAAAAGELSESGLEDEAGRLSGQADGMQPVDRICAVRLLSRHASPAAIQLLTTLAGDQEPAVAGAALHRLNDIDANLVLPLAEAAFQNADQRVRSEGVTAYLRLPTAERVQSVGRLLSDPHVGVRQQVTEGLLKLSEQPELNEPVKSIAMEVLAGDRWQGQEQAALLLGKLRHQPIAQRCVALLDSPRAEARVAVAWALRMIAVEETVPGIVAQIGRRTVQRLKEDIPRIDETVAHLFEALGVIKTKDGNALMFEYIPKRPILGERSRSAAIWALGKIFEGERNAELEDQLGDRIRDDSPTPRESLMVKQMSIVTLARLNCVEEAPFFRQHGSPPYPPSKFATASRWAFKRLTNEELPPLTPNTIRQGAWFLEPLP
ncbi:MAG: hypothetical protein U0872_12650 [Planctomycetaceae bacterium]